MRCCVMFHSLAVSRSVLFKDTMKASITDLLKQLPGKRTEQWPDGERFANALAHGSMSVEVYSPVDSDPQTPHLQDELYFIHAGSGTFRLESEQYACQAGDCFFVPAGAEHRFEDFSSDFVTWVVFWGPKGGEIVG
jgi:mannose-6-phosphate isomerase-like protein (cupin superfamily)